YETAGSFPVVGLQERLRGDERLHLEAYRSQEIAERSTEGLVVIDDDHTPMEWAALRPQESSKRNSSYGHARVPEKAGLPSFGRVRPRVGVGPPALYRRWLQRTEVLDAMVGSAAGQPQAVTRRHSSALPQFESVSRIPSAASFMSSPWLRAGETRSARRSHFASLSYPCRHRAWPWRRPPRRFPRGH